MTYVSKLLVVIFLDIIFLRLHRKIVMRTSKEKKLCQSPYVAVLSCKVLDFCMALLSCLIVPHFCYFVINRSVSCNTIELVLHVRLAPDANKTSTYVSSLASSHCSLMSPTQPKVKLVRVG